MKYCEEFAALLDLYVDGELTAEEALQVESHLEHCADCRAYVDDALAMHAAFAELGEVEVPEGFAETVCAAIRPRKVKKPVHWGRTLASLAACCAVVILLRYGPVGSKGSAEDASGQKSTTAAFDVADMAPAETESVMEESASVKAADAKNYSNTMDTLTTVTHDDAAAEAEEPETAESVEEKEDAPESGAEPEERKDAGTGSASFVSNEFSLSVDGRLLTLGVQSGSFPWGTALQAENVRFWSSDGFDCFEISCGDGTLLGGLRADGADDETDGTLTEIRTGSSAYETYRGAYVGMPLEEFLALYPEAERRVNVEPADHSYTYSSRDSGFNQIVFWFESGTLSSFILANGIDGYLY